jgi:BirA family transcriptional regulator, biotin operon repressor / biotin---[acetyl-CoA-carboxylase] ligase
MEIKNNASIGSTIIRLAQVDSTNTYLKQMAAQLQEGAVVYAENQTSGKGRYGRLWFSDADSLTFSLLIRPRMELLQLPWIALFAAVSITRALHSMEVVAAIKWPNDIELDGRKIGGILVENTVKSDGIIETIIGIGLNVNQSVDDFPSEIRRRATSLRSQTGRIFSNEQVLNKVLYFLDEEYKHFFNPFRADALKKEWLMHCGHLDKPVTVTLRGQKIHGVFIDLTNTGAAVLIVNGRQVVVDNFDTIEELYAADH